MATGYGKGEGICQGTVDVASIRMWLCDPSLIHKRRYARGISRPRSSPGHRGPS